MDYQYNHHNEFECIIVSFDFRNVYVYLGKNFYGYIYGVTLWNSLIVGDTSFKFYTNTSLVPQKENLLLGWTKYEFHPQVFIQPASVKTNSSVCLISQTIATREICDNLRGRILLIITKSLHY